MSNYVFNDTYTVEQFRGINEALSENRLQSGFSPRCHNMDTANGDLAVGTGYVKHITEQVPGTGTIKRMHYWHTLNDGLFVVIKGANIYAWDGVKWCTVFTYDAEPVSTNWDFLECVIASTDYLVIANGETQLVKWNGKRTDDGFENAEYFGSGLYLFETTIASVTYNATQASGVEYAEATESSKLIGTYTITMPDGWSYSENALVSFTVPKTPEDVKTMKAKIGDTTYTLDYVPAWSKDDKVILKFTSNMSGKEACEEYTEEKYGIKTVTLTAAVPDDLKVRVENIGILLNGKSYNTESIDGATVHLKQVCEEELKSGDEAKVRGGVSDIHVNFVQMYFNRLFSAGDPDNPSRLYWSQPPGDYKNIEDWSADDAGADTGGGYVEIGQTTSDPIVGLCALSNQLIVFKQTSIYRLLGDRPSNYRVTLVNRDVETMVNSGRIAYGDVPYWLTRAGMYYHTGQSSQLMGDARLIQNILDKSYIGTCKAAEARDRMYFTIRRNGGEYDDAIIIYDKTDRNYLLRDGFTVIDIASYDGKLYMINENGYVYVWTADAHTYDGIEIEAEWNTPLTDFHEMTVIKAVDGMYLRGERTDGRSGIVKLRYKIGEFEIEEAYEMPEDNGEVLRIPLRNEGRVFTLKISNERGSWFKIMGGVSVHYERKQARL